MSEIVKTIRNYIDCKAGIKNFPLSRKSRFLIFFISAIFFAVTIVSLSQIYPIGSINVGGDGEEYLRFSKLSIFSREFWEVYRMPLFLIFIKINNYRAHQVIAIQQLIFIISIIYFSYKVFFKDDNFTIIGLLCSLLVFLVAINPITSFMLHEFMTETLFYSALIILIAELLRLDEKLNFFAIIFSILCLCFLRSEGVILSILFFPAIIYKFINLNLKNLLKKCLVLTVILGLAFSYTYIYKDKATEGYKNLMGTNIVLMRVALDSEMERYFVKSGMQVDADYKNFTGYGYFAAPKGSVSCRDDKTIPICSWSLKNGWNTYLNFLLSHPLRIIDPFLLGKSLDRGPLSVYQSDASLADIMNQRFFSKEYLYSAYEKIPIFTNIALKIGGLSFYFCLLVFVIALYLLPKKLSFKSFFVGTSLLGSAIIVYHADVLEVTRHLTTYALSIRLFTIYLIFTLFNHCFINIAKKINRIL